MEIKEIKREFEKKFAIECEPIDCNSEGEYLMLNKPVEDVWDWIEQTVISSARKEAIEEAERVVRDVAQRSRIKVGTSLFGYHYEVCSELAKLPKDTRKKKE